MADPLMNRLAFVLIALMAGAFAGEYVVTRVTSTLGAAVVDSVLAVWLLYAMDREAPE